MDGAHEKRARARCMAHGVRNGMVHHEDMTAASDGPDDWSDCQQSAATHPQSVIGHRQSHIACGTWHMASASASRAPSTEHRASGIEAQRAAAALPSNSTKQQATSDRALGTRHWCLMCPGYWGAEGPF
jgi:hypothetical protein